MPENIVAIIGRPNVGKSTLFNRLVGSREAIVYDTPGVTRDRKYGQAEWSGKILTLIDTGGYVPRSEDVFEKAIREQAQIAIEEADSIVFVVDGLEGLTPFDKEISHILRKSKKPVHVIVNKIDSAKLEANQSEFYELGLGDPISLSALGGRKIGDFLDILIDDFHDEGEAQTAETRLRIAIIGRPNVGKSSLVNALLGKKRQVVTEIPGTTRDPADSILKYQGQELIIVDTAGLRKRRQVTESIEFYSTIRTLKSIDRSDVAVVLVDAKAGVDKQDIQIIESTLERHRSCVIAVNKWDLVEKDTNTSRKYEIAIQERLGVYDFIPVIFISALTNQRITKVIDKAIEVDNEQNRRIDTSLLNETILPEIERYPPKSSSPKEIKIKFASQVKTDPPMFVFFCNEPKLVQEAYRRFLDNKLREHFGFSGVPFTIVFKKK
jgi:GTP-binding protein